MGNSRAFQQAITHKILTLSAKVMTFSFFFLSNEGSTVSTAIAAESAQNSPKLPNFVKICERTKACFHRLDFQYKFFMYAFFIVKKWPVYVNFSIPPCGK
jgi:hypothetical protein